MRLDEFREKTKNLPDDAEIIVGLGDGTYWELDFKDTFATIMDIPTTIWLDAKDEITLAFEMDTRIETYIWKKSKE